MLRYVYASLLVVLTAVAVLVGYRLARTHVAVDVYRQRLETVSKDYENLRKTYNDAVRKTAVTELVVENGTLCVNVRTAAGIDRSIPTPFDPSREIYVDYVVLDGRLWIRRVFDQDTPPGNGLVIDPDHQEINWNDPRLAHGKAVYRALSEGRWIVTVTGDGSLGLAKTDDLPAALQPPPPVRDYPQIQQELTGQLEEIGPAEVLSRMVGGS